MGIKLPYFFYGQIFAHKMLGKQERMQESSFVGEVQNW